MTAFFPDSLSKTKNSYLTNGNEKKRKLTKWLKQQNNS